MQDCVTGEVRMKISKILITGIAGSGGSYLAEYIYENHPNVEIHGLAHSRTNQQNLKNILTNVKVHNADLMELGSVLTVLEQVHPDVIFHLAAFANVHASFITPNLFLNNNILGTSNLFEAIRLAHLDPIIQLCSTSEVYGQVNSEDVPIKEDAAMKPASPYAVSKAAQDLLGWTYFTSYNMKIIRTRMFTYLNPRRTDLFASSFSKQVAWIERGLQSELTHGNLDSVRTIIDMRDAMRAYWLAVLHCNPGEAYNIGGTTTMKVGEFLERLIALSETSIPTRCDSALLRPADVTLQIPCVDKFIAKTGWEPEYSFDESIEHLLCFWRKEADEEAKRRSKK
ncbi:MAG TPA: NAD-dependent epimerase/dehydratase family protein [Nitrospinaceae bacterium]|nr:NAD-dependent epimerase/dehydratase family protein [Nitrospinaceae bacterium]